MAETGRQNALLTRLVPSSPASRRVSVIPVSPPVPKVETGIAGPCSYVPVSRKPLSRLREPVPDVEARPEPKAVPVPVRPAALVPLSRAEEKE